MSSCQSPCRQPESHCLRLDLLVWMGNWWNCFEFRLRVALGVGGDLAMISCIRNVDSKPFSFSFAYHAYFSVSDISEVRIEGLETLDYLDNLCHRECFTEQGDAITFESEVDRVYLSKPNIIAILDHEKKRTCYKKGRFTRCCGMESMGEEIEIRGRLWRRGVQAHAVCLCSSHRETNLSETRRGVDGSLTLVRHSLHLWC